MLEGIEKKAVQATLKVFETMFFMPLSVIEEDDEATSGSASSNLSSLRGEIEFSGPSSGRLMLSLPRDLVNTLAGGALSDGEGEITEAHLLDTVNELCNMICGNLLSTIDNKSVWDLSMPKTLSDPFPETEGEAGNRIVNLNFEADDYPLRLQIQWTE